MSRMSTDDKIVADVRDWYPFPLTVEEARSVFHLTHYFLNIFALRDVEQAPNVLRITFAEI